MTTRDQGPQGRVGPEDRADPGQAGAPADPAGEARAPDAASGPPDAAMSPPDRASEALDQLRRERADFLNYRRRVERDRTDDRLRERGDVLARLLPFLDDLDRAMAELPGGLERDPWVVGIALSRSELLAALRSIGVESFGSPGDPFDPALHDAEGFEVRPGVSEPTVAAISRSGYRLGDRVLRPARVAVAGPGNGHAPPTEEELEPWHV
jgi:molecular chaperone GrpE